MQQKLGGTFVISWGQTKIDGRKAAPLRAVEVGAVWSWAGDPVCVDGTNNLLRLTCASEMSDVRKRAAQMVRQLVDAALDRPIATKALDQFKADCPPIESSFVVTDGADSYMVTVIDVAGSAPLLVLLGELPPRERELWIVHNSMNLPQQSLCQRSYSDVICFANGTQITTPKGSKLIEDLSIGDCVHTRDSGLQEIQWIGRRKMNGARLFAMPHLRPIRIKPGALGDNNPNRDLLVSPQHLILLQGARTQELFNEKEVLVAARNLVNGSTVAVDTTLREVTYIHILLPKHEVIWANGIEAESFHPASIDLESLPTEGHSQLLQYMPELARNPYAYGPTARRNLNESDAALLLHQT